MLSQVIEDGDITWIYGGVTADVQNKFDGTAAPGVGNDDTEGYEIGSRWVDTVADKAYICTDASTGAANWVETTAGAAGGETNTASNVGTAGIGVFKQKVGVDLEFKKINAGSSKITITNDAGNSEVDVDVVPANISHTNIADIGTNTHAQIDTHITGSYTDPMTTRGDVLIRNAANNTARLAIGTNTHVLTSDGTDISWSAASGGSVLAHLFLPVESAYLPITNPAALVEHQGATVYSGWSTADFDDTTKESIIWRVPMPDYNDGNIVITAFGRAKSTPGAAKTAQFDILTIGLATSEAFDSAVTVDTTVNLSFSLNTTELQTDIIIATATIDPANVTTDDLMVFELERDVGTDDLVGDFELMYILLEYTKT